MKIKYPACMLTALVLLVLLSAKSVQQSVDPKEPSESSDSEAARLPQSPFPDVCIAGIPDKGDCCL